MKTIGLIGGTGWVSTVDYYRLINQLTNEKLGDSNAAKIILYSVNFQEFKDLIDADDWSEISRRYCGIAEKLKAAGAECIMLGANTAHLIADDVQHQVGLPLVHIADATGRAIKTERLKKVALLGTKFTMEKDFFRNKLSALGIETLLPNEAEREFVHHSIFGELTKGVFSEETKHRYIEIINRLINEGAEGIIYACTEIPILLKEEEFVVKVFDTTQLHAEAVVKFALNEDGK